MGRQNISFMIKFQERAFTIVPAEHQLIMPDGHKQFGFYNTVPACTNAIIHEPVE